MKRAARVVAVLLLLLFVLFAVAWFYVTSDAGSERVRAAALDAVGQSLAGRLEAPRLRLSGGIIVIEDAKLYTPEGELVASLKRAELDVALLGLLKKDVVVRRADVDGLRLYLASDERGFNLARAVAAKVPSAAPASGSAFHVEVRALKLVHGHVDWQKQYVAEDLGLQGAVTVSGPELRLSGKLGLAGSLNELPLRLDVSGDEKKLGVTLALADARLNGELGLNELSARIAELLVPPEVAGRFVEEFPLKVPLVARGVVSTRELDVQLEAGTGRADVKAKLDGAKVPAFHVLVENVDLAELLGRGRPAKLRLEAKGGLREARPEALDLDVALDATWASVGQAHVDATAKAGELHLERLSVDVPGASLTAKGSGNLKAVALHGALDAEDLAKVAKVIAEVTGEPPLALAGTGRADLALTGALQHPRIAAKGELQALHLQDLSFNGVKLDASLADATRPFEATVNAEVARITYGVNSFDEVRLKLDTRGRDLDLALSTTGYTELALLATGTVDPDALGLQLETLTLRYPEEQWRLESPTHLGIGEGLEVQPLVLLASVGQRIALSATSKQGHIDARLDCKQLELTHLPHAFVPTRWGLGGKLDANVVATGKTKAPDIEAVVAWREGSLRTLRGLQLDLKGLYSKDRASGGLTAKSNVGDLTAHFEVPISGLKKQTDEPLSADVSLDGLALEALGPLLELDLPVAGAATLKLDATGTAAKPRVSAHLELKDAAWGGARASAPAERPNLRVAGSSPSRSPLVPVESLRLDIQPDAQGALSATLQARAFGAEASVRLATAMTLEGLRAKPPDAAALRAAEVQLDADVRQVDVAKLVEAGLVSGDLHGVVTVKLTGKGSVDHPDGEVAVVAERVAGGRLKPIDAEVKVVGSRGETTVSVTASRPKAAGQLVKLQATAEAPLEVLADLQRLTTVAFHGGGDVGPFTLADVLEPVEGEAQPRGTVKADVELSGTVVDPKARVRGQLEQVALGKVALGKANFAYDYERALSTVAVTLFTGSAGTLRAKGTVQLDLSQPAVMKGIAWRAAPLQLEAQSNGLDLGFLSGAIEAMPKVEGRLDANAKLGGTLGLPSFVGDASLTSGRLQLAGYGEYRDVEVKLQGNEQVVTLRHLYAKSGGGYADLKGLARKRSDGWAIHLEGETKELPIITDDQLRASVTVDVNADGLVTAEVIDLQKVALSRAVVQLPEVKGKDLQDLERPSTIVLVRNGVPINARQKKKLAELKGQVPEAAPVPARVVRVKVDAPKNLWVKGADVNAELGLSEDFRLEVSQVASLFGDVYVKRGRLDVIGRRFDLDPSSVVHIAGPPATTASVNVIAIYKNEKEGVTVTATVSGQLPQFTIRLTSNPAMSESDIFALVATGRRTLKTGGSAAITNDQVASVVGALAARGLKDAVGKKLPLDVLSFETGSEGFRGTRIEGGKYLTDDVYVGAEARYGADPRKGENDFAVRLEYQFVPHWSLEAYGGNLAYGAELVWSREY